jgi:hypothetical protein
MASRDQWAAGSKLGERTLFPHDLDDIDQRSRIFKLVDENPKRKHYRSRERFALYRNGMSVAEYIAAVGSEHLALADLCWDLNHLFIRIEGPGKVWPVAEAKAKLSEILSLARAGEPQTIGLEEPCVVVSAEHFEQQFQPQHLGRFLIESAPRGYDLELPSRADNRGDPFAADDNDRVA